MPGGGGSLTSQQTATHEFCVFADFETMDTHVARHACPKNRLPWCENLQIVGANNLVTVPAPATAIANIVGKTASKSWYANILNVDYEIIFETDGSMQAINVANGAVSQIAPPGTFTNPDVTSWLATTLLIADPTAGYAAWNGTALSKQGGLSPNILITNGGSGYASGATVAFSGGSGSGATATATVNGGVVSKITLTNAGSGYLPTDIITVTISPVAGGSGATATAKVFPFYSFGPTTLAVFSGRVFLGGGRVLAWTGTGGFDDANPANAAGQTLIPDADLVHVITALRSINNYLWIFGDHSIKQIGTISVSGSSTLFTIVTLTSDIGTTFPQTIASYERLVLFANFSGVYAVLGSSVQKVSNEMDGIFSAIDFSVPMSAATTDITAIRCYLLLVRYIDPVQNRTRSLLLTFQQRRWFVCSQGDNLLTVNTVVQNGKTLIFGSQGADVTQLLAVIAPVIFLLKTALSPDKAIWMGKKILRAAIAQATTVPVTLNFFTETENQSILTQYVASSAVTWLNALGQIVTWINALAQQVLFVGAGFFFKRIGSTAGGTGIYIGATLSGTAQGYTLNNIILEYQETTALASTLSQ